MSIQRTESELIKVSDLALACIASNIRKPFSDWSSAGFAPGVGKEGDLVLVEALNDQGSTTYVENLNGEDIKIHKTDKFIGVLANRHSGTSESGDVPKEGIPINSEARLHLLSVGGVIGINTGIPPTKYKEPFVLKPLGLVKNNGETLNIADMCGPWDKVLTACAPMVIVFGTSAEVGKTTSAASLTRAIKSEGLTVGAIKFAGTGRLRDILSLQGAGADLVVDFPDVGLATTYTGSERFVKATITLLNKVNQMHPDIIVAEAGGDPIEANIPTFLKEEVFMRNVRALVVVAGDVMGMMGTVDYLRKYTMAPIFLTDPKDRNFVTTRERVRQELPGMPIFNSLRPDEVQEITREIIAGL